jgi:hypothetical protein
MSVDHTITCPNCGHTSTCSPTEEVSFVLVAAVPRVYPLHIVEECVAFDTDGEEIDFEHNTDEIKCLACNHKFAPPSWITSIEESDKHEMINKKETLLERDRHHKEQEARRGQDKKA